MKWIVVITCVTKSSLFLGKFEIELTLNVSCFSPKWTKQIIILPRYFIFRTTLTLKEDKHEFKNFNKKNEVKLLFFLFLTELTYLKICLDIRWTRQIRSAFRAELRRWKGHCRGRSHDLRMNFPKILFSKFGKSFSPKYTEFFNQPRNCFNPMKIRLRIGMICESTSRILKISQFNSAFGSKLANFFISFSFTFG